MKLNNTLFAAFSLILAGSVTFAQDQAPLTDSVDEIPLNGFGTWNLERDIAAETVSTAIQSGYRHIDCASAYGNQKEVGQGIRAGLQKAGLRREDIWVTSKLWNDAHTTEGVPKALNQTLVDLDVSYLDLYLMHWPISSASGSNEIEFKDTWNAMSELPTTLTRRTGISNFSPYQLGQLIGTMKTMPYAHQVELHPYLRDPKWLSLHKEYGIHMTAYSPLANTNPIYTKAKKDKSGKKLPQLLENEVIKSIAEKRNCTPAQVALKWGMMRDTSVIPKTTHPDRIRENAAAGQCAMEDDDVEKINRELPTKRMNNPSSSWGVTLYEGLEDGAPVPKHQESEEFVRYVQHSEL